MSHETHVEEICSAINDQVESVVASKPFKDWFENESCKPSDLIVFNNSFLFREGVKTIKHQKYLCVRVGNAGPAPVASIAYPGTMNSRFKRLVDRGSGGIPVESLSDNIAEELGGLGLIIRALVGGIGDDEPSAVATEKIKHYQILRYDPRQTDPAKIEDEIVSINRIDDVDAAWQAIEKISGEQGVDLSGKFLEDFEKNFSELREGAYRPIDIDDLSSESPTILNEIISRIDQQVGEYSLALDAHLSKDADSESLKEMLRIAYNFADGIQALAALMIGISDIKPVVFWLTMRDQFELADRFGNLPFALVGKSKPSIPRYRSVIAGARNRAFHDIFSFGRPFRVRLTGEAFQAPELRLFREYASRRDPALDFADRKLVELLEAFTRAPEQPVPRGFWEANREVMDAVAQASRSIRTALLLLVGNRPNGIGTSSHAG